MSYDLVGKFSSPSGNFGGTDSSCRCSFCAVNSAKRARDERVSQRWAGHVECSTHRNCRARSSPSEPRFVAGSPPSRLRPARVLAPPRALRYGWTQNFGASPAVQRDVRSDRLRKALVAPSTARDRRGWVTTTTRVGGVVASWTCRHTHTNEAFVHVKS